VKTRARRRRVSHASEGGPGGPAAEDFAQYKLQFIDAIQHDSEVIRPIVLFAETIAERSRQTGVERTVVGDKARRFVMEGLLGLVDQRARHAGRKGHVYPEAVATSMWYVKQLYPPIHACEIVRIVAREFGYKTNQHSVQRFVERHPVPLQLDLPMPAFADFAEAYQARWTVVRMWYAGWNKQSIAGGLKLSRTHVYTLLDAFARDGFAGLEDQRTRPPDHPDNQLSLPLLKEVLAIQRESPRAGRFRVQGLLEARQGEPPPSEATVGRAMAINRQLHGAPGPWTSAREEEDPDTTLKHLPYRPKYRHHRWVIEIRYLVKLDGAWVYSSCMLEGYSRKILAGMASAHQGLTAVLQLLFAALAEYGCPEMMISDQGAVFRAED
jgi:putative transposase